MKTLELGTGESQLPGLYRYAGGNSSTGLMRAAQRQGFFAGLIDGQMVTDKPSFLKSAGQALGFPGYYGRNWDAFEECVTDMSWANSAAGYVLIYDDPKPFASASPREWEKALTILGSAVVYWTEKDKAFYVLLRHTRGAAPELPLLLPFSPGWRNRWA